MATHPDRAEPRPVPDKRRAALIATAVTVPLIVILALLFSSIGGGPDAGKQDGPLSTIDVSAPPNVKAEATPCAALLDALPIQLEGLGPRKVNPTPFTPFVLAWGDPAIIVRCGVDKPTGFGPGSDGKLLEIGSGGLDSEYFVSADGDAEVYTAVDRQALVSFTIPGKYPGADYLPVLNKYLVQAMPKQFCSTDPTVADPDKLCDRRTN